MTTVASKANMDRFAERPGVIAYSPTTGEEYSATPGDYWQLAPTDVLTDGNGDPMILVIRTTQWVDPEEEK